LIKRTILLSAIACNCYAGFSQWADKLRNGLGLLRFLLPMLLTGIAASAKDVVWAPLFDQATQYYVELCGVYPTNPYCAAATYLPHPDFTLGLCTGKTSAACAATIKTIINNSLNTAYNKGIRVIDINFFLADANTDLQTTCAADAACAAAIQEYVNISQYWLDAVEQFNVNHNNNTDYFRVRIRVPVNGLVSLARNKKDGSYNDILTDPTLHAIQESSGSRCASLLDLANPKARNYMVLQTKQSLIGASSRLKSGRTIIQEATLALDAGGETCIYGDGPTQNSPFSSFSCGRYPGPYDPINDPKNDILVRKVNYFRNREYYLKMAYKMFADAVKQVNSSVKPSIFYQSWVMDNRIRGSFDLYDLLKGTGVQVLHHDDFVNDFTNYLSLLRHQKHVAEAATVTRALGITFDEELSWAHFPAAPPSTGAGDPNNPLAWAGPIPAMTITMVPKNADSFFDQVHAAFQFGSTGFTYANWACNSILYPPQATSYTTYANWKNIIGANISTGEAVDANFLTGTGGLLSTPLTTTLQSATFAIYMSSMGKMDCEERSTCFGSNYLDALFTNLQLDGALSTNQVDILTDGIIRDGKVDLEKYSAVYFPYETSKVIDIRVLKKFNARASNANVQWVDATGAMSTFAAWKASVKTINVVPITGNILSPLLLK
jgi:hypothetical protein